MIHREPVIELVGVDPYKFAEIRSLGLINEQIDWKQRFFVPTDEEAGSAVLTDLLSRYPVLASDVLTDDESAIAEIEPTEFTPPHVVDLDEWLVAVAETETTSEPKTELLPNNQAPAEETDPFALTPPPDYFGLRPSQREANQLALDFG